MSQRAERVYDLLCFHGPYDISRILEMSIHTARVSRLLIARRSDRGSSCPRSAHILKARQGVVVLRNSNRRQWLASTGSVLVGTFAGAAFSEADEKKEKPGEPEVTAAEDLMREHGILRRALLVYAETSVRLVQQPSDIP